MNCDEVEELAGAYALRALPAETLREVQEHLTTCSAHPDIVELRQVASSLAQAAPEREPPATLKARLMEAIRAEAAPAEAPRKAVTPARRRWAWPRWWTRPRLSPYSLAAALALAVVGLVAWNVSLQISEDGQDETLVRALSGAGQATGRIVYLRDEGEAVLTVKGLPPLAEDRTYQVWALSEQGAEGIGLFDTSPDGEASTVMDVDLSRAEAIAVTVEPAGGSPQPTTAPLLIARL